MNLKDMKSEYRLSFCGDNWGHAMAWHFAIADEIFFNRSFPVPHEWQFKPSPLGPSNDPESYETAIVENADDESLLLFGKIIFRLCQYMSGKGMSY